MAPLLLLVALALAPAAAATPPAAPRDGSESASAAPLLLLPIIDSHRRRDSSGNAGRARLNTVPAASPTRVANGGTDHADEQGSHTLAASLFATRLH